MLIEKGQNLQSFFCGYAHTLRCQQNMQSFEIACQTHQTPFTANFFQATQGKLAES